MAVAADRLAAFVTGESPKPKKKADAPNRKATGGRGPHKKPGDYSSLDVVRWFESRQHYRRPGNSSGKHYVLCPWSSEHSDQRGPEASDTVIWEAEPGKWPGFHCSHSHCLGRDIQAVMTLWGDADAFCTREFVRQALGERATPAFTIEDFLSLSTMDSYIFIPTGDLWPRAKVNGQLPRVFTGETDEHGNRETETASAWCDREKPAHQMTWAPGQPPIIEGKLIVDGEWREYAAAVVYNQYTPPIIRPGNAEDIAPWREHLERLYPESAEHLTYWFAHRVQRPGEKVNHALVLGGLQGIGKDTLLDPVCYAVGTCNCAEVSPMEILGRFNGFRKSVILRISEARDLGERERYIFYEHLKGYITTPPHVFRVDEKNRREYVIPNVCGVILTTNHRAGIYLPPDDRRHYVVWSECTKEQFTPEYWRGIWGWYEAGGRENVASYLMSVDLSQFNPKAPPPQTDAFKAIVDADRTPEDAELADALEALGHPDVISKEMLLEGDLLSVDFKDWLQDRRNARKLPHRFESNGYVPVQNPRQTDGRWCIRKKNMKLYARKELTPGERMGAAERLASSP